MRNNMISLGILKHNKTMPVMTAQKLLIVTYSNPLELLNKILELVSKCQHENKFSTEKLQ